MIQTDKKTISVIFRKKVMTVFFSVVFAISGSLAIAALASSFYDVNIIETAPTGVQTVQNVSTNESSPVEIVKVAGIEIEKNDVVDTSEFKSGEDSDINIYRSCSITLCDDGNEIEIPAAASTVEYTLESNSIELSENDTLNCELDDIVHEGMTVEIYRAFTVKIDDNGETAEVELSQGTVADALEKAGIELDEDDSTDPDLDTQLYEGIEIKVLRTDYVVTTENKTIKFEKKTVKDNTLSSGTKKVTQEGKDGEELVTTTKKIVNGKVVDTKVTTETVKKAVDEITKVGTHIEPITLKNGVRTVSSLPLPEGIEIDSNGVPTNYKSTMEGRATAYHCGTHTATGKGVRTGYVAVNPKIIPYGTKMWIVSLDGSYVYGYAVAEDTGGFCYNGSGTMVDLYFDSIEECYQFGARGVRIYFL